MDKIDALKLMAAKSANASHEAIRAIAAIDINSPMAGRRYNHVVDIAFNDPGADFTRAERELIVDCMGADRVGRGRPAEYSEPLTITAARFSTAQLRWLNSQPDGLASTLRKLVDLAMSNETDQAKYFMDY